MRIDAKLPENLWPEPIMAAVYLMNLTPIKRLDWKSPIEMLHTALNLVKLPPDVRHLCVYGCRVYALVRNLPRTRKLAPRAHIGYLVGYESSNISCVWVPHLKKIIVTHNVTFNETRQYNLIETDLTMLLWEEIEQIVEIIKLPSSDHVCELPRLGLETGHQIDTIQTYAELG